MSNYMFPSDRYVMNIGSTCTWLNVFKTITHVTEYVLSLAIQLEDMIESGRTTGLSNLILHVSFSLVGRSASVMPSDCNWNC